MTAPGSPGDRPDAPGAAAAPASPGPAARGRDGFRVRTREVTRLEGFSDAVFGFALTLLVVTLDVPRTFDQLLDDLRGFPAFGICFVAFLQIWHAHRGWFRRYGLEDAWTVALNGALLFVVLAYVYPLRFLFTLLTGQFTGIVPQSMVASGPMIRDGQVRQLMFLYGAGFAAVEGLFLLLHVRAWWAREALGLDALERFGTVALAVKHALLAAVALVSLGLTAAGASPFAAGMAYFLTAPAMTLHGIARGVLQRRLAARLAAAGLAA